MSMLIGVINPFVVFHLFREGDIQAAYQSSGQSTFTLFLSLEVKMHSEDSR